MRFHILAAAAVFCAALIPAHPLSSSSSSQRNLTLPKPQDGPTKLLSQSPPYGDIKPKSLLRRWSPWAPFPNPAPSYPTPSPHACHVTFIHPRPHRHVVPRGAKGNLTGSGPIDPPRRPAFFPWLWRPHDWHYPHCSHGAPSHDNGTAELTAGAVSPQRKATMKAAIRSIIDPFWPYSLFFPPYICAVHPAPLDPHHVIVPGDAEGNRTASAHAVPSRVAHPAWWNLDYWRYRHCHHHHGGAPAPNGTIHDTASTPPSPKNGTEPKSLLRRMDIYDPIYNPERPVPPPFRYPLPPRLPFCHAYTCPPLHDDAAAAAILPRGPTGNLTATVYSVPYRARPWLPRTWKYYWCRHRCPRPTPPSHDGTNHTAGTVDPAHVSGPPQQPHAIGPVVLPPYVRPMPAMRDPLLPKFIDRSPPADQSAFEPGWLWYDDIIPHGPLSDALDVESHGAASLTARQTPDVVSGLESGPYGGRPDAFDDRTFSDPSEFESHGAASLTARQTPDDDDDAPRPEIQTFNIFRPTWWGWLRKHRPHPHNPHHGHTHDDGNSTQSPPPSSSSSSSSSEVEARAVQDPSWIPAPGLPLPSHPRLHYTAPAPKGMSSSSSQTGPNLQQMSQTPPTLWQISASWRAWIESDEKWKRDVRVEAVEGGEEDQAHCMRSAEGEIVGPECGVPGAAEKTVRPYDWPPPGWVGPKERRGVEGGHGEGMEAEAEERCLVWFEGGEKGCP